MKRQVGVAVIGAGQWGPNLIRNFYDNPTSQLLWVVDKNSERLKQVASRYQDVQTTENLGKALKDSDVEAVVIATPPTTHFAIASAALKAGKHVLVEKPITTKSTDAVKLNKLAAKQKRILMVGHVFIYNPVVRWIKDYIKSGQLGKIYYIMTARTNLGPFLRDVTVGWDLAPHDISIVNYWLGSEPTSVSAIGNSWINTGVDELMFATLHYPKNVLVNIHTSWFSPRKVREIVIVGEKKMLIYDDMNQNEPLRVYDKRVGHKKKDIEFADTFGSFKASIKEGDISIPKIPVGEPLRMEVEHFIDCIIKNTKPDSSGKDGLAVVRTLETITRAIRKSKAEKV